MKSRRKTPRIIRTLRRVTVATAIGLLTYVATNLRAVPKDHVQPAQTVAHHVKQS